VVFKFPVDATNEEEYLQLRYAKDQSYNWDRLLFNINKLSNLPRTFLLTFSFVINGYNYQNMNKMIDLAVKYHANSIYFMKMLDSPYQYINNTEKQDAIRWIYNNKQELLDRLAEAKILAKQNGINLTHGFSP
jgi:wyosine [tRNA(Phe)-imidazoG37] synthetase (radical SAM superfamily)